MTVSPPLIRRKAKDVIEGLQFPVAQPRPHPRNPLPEPVVPLREPTIFRSGATPGFARLPWEILALLMLLAAAGLAALYAAAGDSYTPWASRHARFLMLGVAAMTAAAAIHPDTWKRYAYVNYAGALGLLVTVEVVTAGPGVHRWLDFGFFTFQPLEPMKIALILALARYFSEARRSWVTGLVPLAMILVPTALVFEQPDLSGAALLALSGAAVIYLAGSGSVWLAAGAVAAMAPLAWQSLYAYQQRRVIAFLDPESEPLGVGWQILQSWQALAAGGLTGRGDVPSSSFYAFSTLPLRHNDFVFSVLTEKLGLIGALALLGLFSLVILRCVAISRRSSSAFGRLLAGGIAALLAMHVAAHVAVAVGYLPVTGVPLPLISDGGTMTITVLFAFGLLIGVRLRERLERRRQPRFRRRLWVLACGSVLVLAVLAARLVQVQMLAAAG